jgi:hypothetical protein
MLDAAALDRDGPVSPEEDPMIPIRVRSLALLALAGGTVAAQPPHVRVVNAAAPTGGSGQNWGSAFNNLQAALNAAASSSGQVTEIWLAAGEYRPTHRTEPSDPGTATFELMSGLAIYGGFAGGETMRQERNPAANPAILTGIGLATRPYHIVIAMGVDATCILDGVHITGAMPGFAPGADRGGGMVIAGSPRVQGCIISGNSSGSGGGVYISSGSPIFLGCTIAQNSTAFLGSGGAGVLVTGGSPLFDRCTFEGNQCVGPVSGGAVKSSGAGTVTLRSCRIVGNTADAAGAVGGSNFTIVNSLVRGNPGGVDGAAAVNLVNCTVIDNPPSKSGLWSGVHASISGSLSNCIVWGNRQPAEPGLYPQVWGNISASYSCVEPNAAGPGISGAGLIREDPCLADADGRPGFYSPCIDSGSNAAVPTDLFTDLDGAERIRDDAGMPDYGLGAAPFVDMGAYEFQGTTCYANCDRTTAGPALSIADFACFMARFAAGDRLANCDSSSAAPTLNILDFGCFLNKFAAGCP